MSTKKSQDNYLKFLSIIAHNVKGPVRYMEFITNYTLQNWQTLQATDLLECAKVINESARNIAEQLGDILSWARLQDGTFKPNKSSFLVWDAIEDECRLQRPILTLKEITLEKKPTEAVELFSDKNLLSLAFHNIFTNAIKFTKKAGTIVVEARLVNNMLLLSVADSGIGMTPKELALIYDDKSFSKPGTINEHGSGFGLHIAKEIVELLDGNIEVDSQENVGTTVTICIPI